jgi:hypothetical protein
MQLDCSHTCCCIQAAAILLLLLLLLYPVAHIRGFSKLANTTTAPLNKPAASAFSMQSQAQLNDSLQDIDTPALLVDLDGAHLHPSNNPLLLLSLLLLLPVPLLQSISFVVPQNPLHLFCFPAGKTLILLAGIPPQSSRTCQQSTYKKAAVHAHDLFVVAHHAVVTSHTT